MSSFIAGRIKLKYDSSVEDGHELYRKFFIDTKIYRRWKKQVDDILIKDGYEEAIVTE